MGCTIFTIDDNGTGIAVRWYLESEFLNLKTEKMKKQTSNETGAANDGNTLLVAAFYQSIFNF